MTKQLDLWLPENGKPRPDGVAEIAHDDAVPEGPYRISLTRVLGEKGVERYERPYCLLAGNGQCVAGHIESAAVAKWIEEKING